LPQKIEWVGAWRHQPGVDRNGSPLKIGYERRNIRKKHVSRILPMRGNLAVEYAQGASRILCKTFPGMDAPAKIHLLLLQAINVRAGKKRAGYNASMSAGAVGAKNNCALALKQLRILSILSYRCQQSKFILKIK